MNTGLEDLQSKLIDIGDAPTQRLIVAILYKNGFSVDAISDWFEKSERTIYQWFNWIETENLDEALYNDDGRGSSPKLSKDKHYELEEILRNGAEASGFTGQIWTGPRVADVIEQEFNVCVSDETARRYMRKLGWSRQKPQRRSIERDENAIDNFINKEWIDIRQTAKETNRKIIFIDETKFRLMPTFKHTWAPIGETPTVETSGLFEYVAVIGALVYHPETHKLDLQWEKQRHNFKTQDVLNFLQNLIHKIPQELVFILDNLSAHKAAVDILEGKEMKNLIKVEWFPEYSSDINPVDNVWGQAKYNELANYTPKDLDELETKVEETLTDIQADEGVLRYCIKDAGLEIEA